MNQEKVGKFIQQKRKEKNLTQEELATKLGVSNRTISKWENGHGMPDYSMILELCKVLDMSINELLSGEEIKKENYQTMLEENMLKTIDYNNKKRNKKNKIIALFVVLGVVLLIAIGYKLLFTYYYTTAYHNIYDSYKEPTVEKKDLKSNDKANTTVQNLYKMYIPEGFELVTDLQKSTRVRYGCSIFINYSDEGKENASIEFCDYEGFLDEYDVSGYGFDTFNVHQLLFKYNINSYYDLINYYLEHKDDKYNIFSKKDDIRLMSFIKDNLGSSDYARHYIYSNYLKGWTTIFSPEGKFRLASSSFILTDVGNNYCNKILYIINQQDGTLSESDVEDILGSIKANI